MTLNDEILRATRGTTVPDGLLVWYQAGGATSSNLDDAELQWLKIQLPLDVSTNTQDLWSAYLIGEGYAGSLDDMKLAFWTAQP